MHPKNRRLRRKLKRKRRIKIKSIDRGGALFLRTVPHRRRSLLSHSGILQTPRSGVEKVGSKCQRKEQSEERPPKMDRVITVSRLLN